MLAEAAGNPLALLELPRVLAGAQPEGPLPLTDRLRAAFESQLTGLPEPARTVLLVAAAEGTGDLAPILRAAGTLGASLADLDPARAAGLIEVNGSALTFRHPLIRAAVHHTAPLAQRRAVHQALAAALDAPGQADRRAWQLAAAAAGPDEEIAAALERAAGQVRERGGDTGALAWYQRAAELSADPVAKARRLTLAAETAAGSGDLDQAAALAGQSLALTAAGATPEQARLTAQALQVQATVAFLRGEPAAAHRRLLEASELIAAVDPEQANALLDRGGARRLVRRPGRAGRSRDPARGTAPAADGTGTAAAARGGADPRTARRPVRSERRAGRGQVGRGRERARAGAGVRARAAARPGRGGAADRRRAEPGPAGGRADRLAADRAVLLRVGAGVRRTSPGGTAAPSPKGCGWPATPGSSAGSDALAEPLALLAAARGDEQLCRQLTAEALSRASRPAWNTPWTSSALGLLDLGLGRAESALGRLETLAEGRRFFHIAATRSTPDLVEAAVRLGRPEAAAEPLALFETWSRNTGQGWTSALVHRCRALLDGDEDLFLAALALHEEDSRPFDEARTQLLYGEWLRREKRKADARAQLRVALETFERIGAAPWAERARTELTATGTTGRAAEPRPVREPHAAGVADRPAGRAGPVQQGHRRAALPQRADRRAPPLQGVPEARRGLPGRAGRPGARLKLRRPTLGGYPVTFR